MAAVVWLGRSWSAPYSVSLDPAQRAEAVGARATRDVAGVRVGLELVRHAGTEVELDGHAGSAESLRVGEVLVTEYVELTDLDVARWQIGKVGGASWRGIRRHVRTADSVAEEC